jgi:hypothetical protein
MVVIYCRKRCFTLTSFNMVPNLYPQVVIKATGERSAELVTDEGAIYVTSNMGYNWKAAVEETVSATLNRYFPALVSGLQSDHKA